MFYTRAPYSPLRGRRLHPSGLPPLGSGSATQRPTFGCPQLRYAQKTKPLVASLHTKASVMMCCVAHAPHKGTKDSMVAAAPTRASSLVFALQASHQGGRGQSTNASSVKYTTLTSAPFGAHSNECFASKTLHKGIFLDIVGSRPTRSVLRGKDKRHRLSKLIKYA